MITSVQQLTESLLSMRPDARPVLEVAGGPYLGVDTVVSMPETNSVCIASTRPATPVDLLASAIATQEGFWVEGSTPQKYNNPGDLRFAGQLNAVRSAPPIDGVEQIAVFSTLQAGVTALYRQLWLWVALGLTVRQMIHAQDEATETVYLQNVIEWTQLPVDTPVIELIPALVKLN